ncbi:MAG: aldo/keto reductase [Verrucomicrobiota bacterium]|jgi:aryl-alcohol dehydrogenase-like predicted oxidoreductase|nr:aldo/keto reductase [Verrucomicrobiota bacterium]
METTRLGRTGLHVSRTAFGVLPIQRIPLPEAVRILRRAHEAGITFFDTARAYSDSEEKIGAAFGDGLRDSIILASKSGAATADGLRKDLETSLRNLRTDHLDILQLHNPDTLYAPDDAAGPLHALLRARDEGKVRFVGITNHSLTRARQAVASGLYDTLQFPLSALSDADDLSLAEQCRAADVGLIAMKALAGGLLNNARVAFAFLRQYPNIVPIWGIQRMTELEEFLALEADPPPLDDALREQIARDKQELGPSFCRGCGYCMPCPEKIVIMHAARMPLLLRRAPAAPFLTPEFNAQMQLIRNCRSCGHCRAHCPYHLDTPALLRTALADYEKLYAQAR